MSVRLSWAGTVFSLVLVMALVFTTETEALDPVPQDGRFGMRGFKWKKRDDVRLDKACDSAKDAGVGWTRLTILWKDVVTSEGDFRWFKLDRQVRKLLKRKIKILCTFRSVHEFAPNSGPSGKNGKFWRSARPAPEHEESYKAFVREIVERYDGDGLDAHSNPEPVFINDKGKNIKYWQIENEPGKDANQVESLFWYGDVYDYAALYMDAYDTIKTADPEAQVLLAGFSDGQLKACNQMENDDDVETDCFLTKAIRLLKQGNRNFDIFDYHFYRSYARISAYQRKANKFEKADIEGTFDDLGKPTWVTETSIGKSELPKDVEVPIDAYDAYVAKELVKKHTIFFKKKVKKVFWVEYSDKVDPPDGITRGQVKNFRGLCGKFNIEDESPTPKPAYYTYQMLVGKINGLNVVDEVSAPSGVQMFAFEAPEGESESPVIIAWCDTCGESPVSLALGWGSEQSVLATTVVTELTANGEPVIDATNMVTDENGELLIVLDDRPVFIEQQEL